LAVHNRHRLQQCESSISDVRSQTGRVKRWSVLSSFTGDVCSKSGTKTFVFHSVNALIAQFAILSLVLVASTRGVAQHEDNTSEEDFLNTPGVSGGRGLSLTIPHTGLRRHLDALAGTRVHPKHSVHQPQPLPHRRQTETVSGYRHIKPAPVILNAHL